MPTNRIQRVNEDIHRVLSALLRNIKDPRLRQGIVSVTAVDTTGDLRRSNIYVSAFGLGSEKDFLRALKSASGYLRRELGAALSLRHTPELNFHLDKSIEHGAKINEILGGLDIQPEDSGEARQNDDK